MGEVGSPGVRIVPEKASSQSSASSRTRPSRMGSELPPRLAVSYRLAAAQITSKLKSSTTSPSSLAPHRFEMRLEERLHPHSAFMTGLVRVMGNVGVLVFWIFLAIYFMSHGLVTPDWPGKLACVDRKST